MPDDRGRLETAVTYLPRDVPPAVEAVLEELHPMQFAKPIPLHVTLLYPFVPREDLRDDHVGRLREFFAERGHFSFELGRVLDMPGVVYLEPAPVDELLACQYALWALFPETPPYDGRFPDLLPHATLALADDQRTRRELAERIATRLNQNLPISCAVDEVALLEEHEPDRCSVRERFALGVSVP